MNPILMSCYQLVCECGYESNQVSIGVDAWSDSFSVPVLVPNCEEVMTVTISPRDDESDEEFESRLARDLAVEARNSFGPDAVVFAELPPPPDKRVTCPRCKRELARFEFIGF